MRRTSSLVHIRNGNDVIGETGHRKTGQDRNEGELGSDGAQHGDCSTNESRILFEFASCGQPIVREAKESLRRAQRSTSNVQRSTFKETQRENL
jgi:hypothetical protein